MRPIHLIGMLTLFVAGPAAAMTLTSADIAPGAAIPARQVYARCGGSNQSPQLSWRGAPPGTRSFAVTMIDLDVKPAQWSHWIVVDLPATVTSLPTGARSLPAPGRALASDFGDAAYGGPCPPRGSGVHHYQITVWALPTPRADLPPGGAAAVVSGRLSKAAIDHASLTGTVRG